MFFCAALPLIALIYLRPDGAMRLAALLPSAEIIGYGIALACALGFGFRLHAWRQGPSR